MGFRAPFPSHLFESPGFGGGRGIRVTAGVLVTYKRPPTGTLRQIAKARKQVHLDVVKYWHSKFFLRHFTTQASQKYKYQKRAWWTSRMKMLRFGHHVPMMLTGESKTRMSENPRFSATSKAGRVKMRPPYYFLIRRKRNTELGLSPDMASEVTRVTTKEMAELGQYSRERLREIVAKYNPAPTKKFIPAT